MYEGRVLKSGFRRNLERLRFRLRLFSLRRRRAYTGLLTPFSDEQTHRRFILFFRSAAPRRHRHMW